MKMSIINTAKRNLCAQIVGNKFNTLKGLTKPNIAVQKKLSTMTEISKFGQEFNLNFIPNHSASAIKEDYETIAYSSYHFIP